MTPQDIDLVRSTWQQVRPHAATFADNFYRRLFELDPSLSHLFRSDLREQGRRLVKVLNYCVENLDELPTIVPQVQMLGRRHVEYGVRDENYDTVGEALLGTFARHLGATFDAAARGAWSSVYTTLADTMRNAARRIAA